MGGGGEGEDEGGSKSSTYEPTILSVTPWHSFWHTVPRKKFVALCYTRRLEDYYYYLTKQFEQLMFERFYPRESLSSDVYAEIMGAI